MNYRIVLSDRAGRELGAATQWWAEHRSIEQAEHWYNGFLVAIDNLRHSALRCGAARESGQFPFEVRQLNYGARRRPTHRAVFTIQGDAVVVLSIRHLAQRDLAPDDLS